jgi:hypothetical protein
MKKLPKVHIGNINLLVDFRERFTASNDFNSKYAKSDVPIHIALSKPIIQCSKSERLVVAVSCFQILGHNTKPHPRNGHEKARAFN